MRKYSIFLARSFEEHEKPLFQLVSGVCEALGLEPLPTDEASIDPVSEKVRALLDEAELVVALLTRDRQLKDSSTWHASQWVISEIGMRKPETPLAVLVEKGVEVEGPAPDESCFFTFDRSVIEGPISSATIEFLGELVKFLAETKDKLHERSTTSRSVEGQTYTLDELDIEFDISPSGVLTTTQYMVVKSAVPKLDRIINQRLIITSSKQLGFRGEAPSLQDYSSTNKKRRRLELEFDRLEDRLIEYDIVLDPPLSLGETVAMTIVHRSQGSLPLLVEDAEHLISGKDYMFPEPIARQGKAIKVPTGKLRMEVRFPVGYQVEDVQLTAPLAGCAGSSKESIDEVARIQRNGSWRILHNRLQLEVPQPLVNHAYYISWTPPDADSVNDAASMRLFAGDTE